MNYFIIIIYLIIINKMASVVGVSKTTNNLPNRKSNNITNPKKWIINVKQSIGSINLFIPTNQPKNITINSIIKNNGSIDIPNIKITLDKINNKLNLIKKFSESIDNYINTQPNLIYPKPTSIFNQNNIDSLKQNVEKRLATLKQLKESLTTYNNSINTNKADFIKLITEQIDKFISDKYISALNIKKQELTDINTQMTDLVNTIKQNLKTNKPIKKNYTKLKNIPLNKNNTLKTNFNSLKTSLTNSLKNITLNTTLINESFSNYNQKYKRTAINLNSESRNINKAISIRVTALNDNIKIKTDALDTLMNNINSNIEKLKSIINDNKTIFNNEQKIALGQIIDNLSTSIKGSTKNFNAENEKLKEIVASLRNLIGNSTGNKVLGQNANGIKTNITKSNKNSNSNSNGNVNNKINTTKTNVTTKNKINTNTVNTVNRNKVFSKNAIVTTSNSNTSGIKTVAIPNKNLNKAPKLITPFPI